jgi:hypothetical protein
MKCKLFSAVLIAASASIAAPAFATSGYGPAPFYNPEVGAPASQRGPSAQTIAAENADQAASSERGGVSENTTQSGNRAPAPGMHSIYFGR